MPITTIYRAYVYIPQDVYERVGHTKGYDQCSLAISKRADRSGQNAYSEVEEWAEYSNKQAAEDFCTAWHNAILSYKREPT